MRPDPILNISDEQLLQQYQDGDTTCLGVLYKRYYKKVFHKCLSFVKDYEDAFDLAQDSLLKALNKLATFHGEAKFSTWLYTITCNECLQFIRKHRNKHFEDSKDSYDIAEDTEQQEVSLMMGEQEELLDLLLRRLSEEDRKILWMKYWNHASIKELQQVFHLATASAVKMRLQRSRKKVMDLYQSQHMRSAGA